jgi:hypothetical protein
LSNVIDHVQAPIDASDRPSLLARDDRKTATDIDKAPPSGHVDVNKVPDTEYLATLCLAGLPEWDKSPPAPGENSEGDLRVPFVVR